MASSIGMEGRIGTRINAYVQKILISGQRKDSRLNSQLPPFTKRWIYLTSSLKGRFLKLRIDFNLQTLNISHFD